MKLHSVLLITLVAGPCLTADAQSVDDQIRERAGFGIQQVRTEGRPAFSLPPGIVLSAALPSDDAVAIALWNNTGFQASLAGLEVARADVTEAGQFRNPSLSALLPVGPKPFEFLLAWPIEELWQRKQRVKAAQLNLDAISTGLVQNGLDLIRSVRLAYVDLWFAEARSRILTDSAQLRARIATFTEKRRDVGDGTGLDVSLASADAQSAADLARMAVSDVEIARSRLRHLLGMTDRTQTLSSVPARVQRPELPALQTLIEIAAVNRPDLRAAELTVQVQADRAKWQRSQVLAMMAPTLSIKEVGTDGLRAGPGLNMDIPVLSRNKGRIERSDAEVLRAGRDYAALRDRIEQEVAESWERTLQSLASQGRLARQVRPRVEQSIRLTQRAYENGDISLLSVLEATRQQFDLDLRDAEMYAVSERARAELERAIGRRL